MLNNIRTGLPFYGMGYDMNSVAVFARCMGWKKYSVLSVYKGRYHCIPVCCASVYDLQVYLGVSV